MAHVFFWQLDWIWAPDFTFIGNNDFYDYRSEQWWNDARITGGATDPGQFSSFSQ